MATGKEAFKETSQREFLSSVREALGVAEVRSSPSRHPEPKLEAAGHAEKVREERLRLALDRKALAEQMERMATISNWRVRRAKDSAEALMYVGALIDELDAKKIALTDHPVLQRLSMASHLRTAGIPVVVGTLDEAKSREEMHRQINEADLGITGVDYALAETGSCIILPRPGVSRVVSLLPTFHLAIVEASQIVENFEELMALRRDSFLQDGKLSSYMSIITGPSRTGDIEQTIVIGAHGPRQVHMLIVDDLNGNE